MALVLTEEQNLLKSSASDFVKKESPLVRIRTLRDSEDPVGFSKDIWAKMAQLGWQGILIPEEYGGLGLGYAEVACVMEECGRNLVPEPLLSTVLLGGNAVLLAGSEQQKRDILPSVAAGELLLTLAYQERGSRYDLFHCTTTASKSDGGYVLDGEKTLVLDGHVADKIIVTARQSGAPNHKAGLSLFVVDRDTPGVEIERQSTMHLRSASIVRLSGVELPASALLGAEGACGEALEDTIDRATAGLCAEMLGNSQACFEMTLEYLKTRQQFGVVIGSFQALKHRAANMFVELELSRSAVMGACDALDGTHANAREYISMAKARCSDTAVLVAYEGVQMHGGIGMTDEHDVGFYAKRARGSEMTFGDAAYHRDRFATLQGY